jgi:hypothetical protein
MWARADLFRGTEVYNNPIHTPGTPVNRKYEYDVTYNYNSYAVDPVLPEYNEVKTYGVSFVILIAAVSSSLGTFYVD